MNRPVVLLGSLFLGAIALRFAVARGPGAQALAAPVARPSSPPAAHEPVADAPVESADAVPVEFVRAGRADDVGRLVWCGTGLGVGEGGWNPGPELDAPDPSPWEGGTIRVKVRDVEWDRLLCRLKELEHDVEARALVISRFLADRIPRAGAFDVEDLVERLRILQRDPMLRSRLERVEAALRAGAPWKAALDADPAQAASPASAPAGR